MSQIGIVPQGLSQTPNLDQYIACSKQRIIWMKTGTRTLVAAMPYTVFDIAGSPGAGVLNVGNTANGLVPTDAVAGYPVIASFAGQTGRVIRADYGSSVASCLDLYDRLFVAGAYAFNADITLADQPSYASRVPNGNYNCCQLWIEAVTAFTGVLNVQIDYLDQDGNAGVTGIIATLALPIGRMYNLPLASGDSGVSQIVRVRGTVATVGTFNVMVLRPIFFARIRTANDGGVQDILSCGMEQVYEDSALYMVLYADSTAVGLPLATLTLGRW